MTIINAYQLTRGKAGGEPYPGWIGQNPLINLNAAQRKTVDTMWLLTECERKHTTTYEASLELFSDQNQDLWLTDKGDFTS